MTHTIAITGNTYPVKDQLKALGARWNPDKKAWMVEPAVAEQARALVASAGPKYQQAAPYSNKRRYGNDGEYNRPAYTQHGPCRKCGSYCYGDCTAND